MERALRPCDELDEVCLDAWNTVKSVRPKFPTAPEPKANDASDDASDDAANGLRTGAPKSLQQFLTNLSDSDAENLYVTAREALYHVPRCD